jgi:hypothetical protein
MTVKEMEPVRVIPLTGFRLTAAATNRHWDAPNHTEINP